MLYLDTETCGFHGPICLVQYAVDDGEIVLYEPWQRPISETIALYTWFCEQTVCAFNLAFDWFHICQQATTLLLLQERVGPDALPIDHINEYAECEKDGRDGPCFKPKSCLDLMLVARKGAYQATMDRKPIRIKKVPREFAEHLTVLLDQVIPIPEIYFSRKKNHKEGDSHWRIVDVDDQPDLVNLELNFAPSTGLKELCKEIFGDKIVKIKDVGVHKKFMPIEVGWAPFALALSNKDRRWRAKKKKGGQFIEGYAWPGVIEWHIKHWRFNNEARDYAANDIDMLRRLYVHFSRPESGDKDSTLAAMVGSVRWRGYAINTDGIRELRRKAIERSNQAPKDPHKVYQYIVPDLTDAEKDKLRDDKTGRVSTKKVLLEEMSKWKKPCLECLDQISVMGMLAGESTKTICKSCKGTGELDEPHPVALKAKACLDARQGRSETTLWDKLLQAGRFHASFSVIGAFSARMAGTDGLNAQGIQHRNEIRKQFTLAFGELVPTGGDFVSFEVSIADAIVDDQKLRDALRTCEKCKYLWKLDEYAYKVACPNCGQTDKEGKPCRQKFHGIFGIALTGGTKTYDEILATKGSSDDLYDKGKRGGFSQFYGGNWNTLVIRLGVSEEIAKSAEEYFQTEYQGVGRWRAQVKEDFCSMRQPDGIGGKVEWHDPKPYVESLTGHRRYFTLENDIAKALFTLSANLPEGWKQAKGTVVRHRDRGPQKICGAIMSALYAAAFNVQAAVMRAAANHIIQSTGAELTKMLQVALWELQPPGVHKWHIQPMNVHDEIMCPCLPQYLTDGIPQIIDKFIKKYHKLIPLIAIDWTYNMKTWADK